MLLNYWKRYFKITLMSNPLERRLQMREFKKRNDKYRKLKKIRQARDLASRTIGGGIRTSYAIELFKLQSHTLTEKYKGDHASVVNVAEAIVILHNRKNHTSIAHKLLEEKGISI